MEVNCRQLLGSLFAARFSEETDNKAQDIIAVVGCAFRLNKRRRFIESVTAPHFRRTGGPQGNFLGCGGRDRKGTDGEDDGVLNEVCSFVMLRQEATSWSKRLQSSHRTPAQETHQVSSHHEWRRPLHSFSDDRYMKIVCCRITC